MSRTGSGSIFGALARLDAWLIAGPYQAIVDLSQRAPAWLARQCIVCALVLECLRIPLFPPKFTGVHCAFLALTGVGLLLCWFFTKSPAWFAAVGSWASARAAIITICIIRVLLMPFGVTALGAYNLLSDLVILSFCCFAACKPPRPRVPRTSMAGVGGAA